MYDIPSQCFTVVTFYVCTVDIFTCCRLNGRCCISVDGMFSSYEMEQNLLW